jgi:hypothetical protein
MVLHVSQPEQIKWDDVRCHRQANIEILFLSDIALDDCRILADRAYSSLRVCCDVVVYGYGQRKSYIGTRR